MSNYKVELIENSPRCVLGEGPHWDIPSQNLYYIDMKSEISKVFRYSYAENKIYTAIVEGESVISFIIPIEGAKEEFVIGVGKRVVRIKWDGVSTNVKVVSTLYEVEQGVDINNRLNDGKADPRGRLFAGTMKLENNFEEREGGFYRFDKNKMVKKLLCNIGVSNGLTWNEKTKRFYYIDTAMANVREFDYDIETGGISNERILIDFKINGERPEFKVDGMTIDSNGFLYVATWGGSRVFKINPNTAKVELEIPIPAEQVTSLAFGGPNLDILYVTTASVERESAQPPPSGQLFKVTGLGVKGLPMANVRV